MPSPKRPHGSDPFGALDLAILAASFSAEGWKDDVTAAATAADALASDVAHDLPQGMPAEDRARLLKTRDRLRAIAWRIRGTILSSASDAADELRCLLDELLEV